METEPAGTTADDAPKGNPARIAVGPAGSPRWLADAVRAGGAEVVPVEQADGLLWADPADPGALRGFLDSASNHIRWVQLPWAGIEPYVDVLDDQRVWTCGKGVYAEPVAELALTLTLAAMRGVDRYARSDRWGEAGELGVNLRGARVTVLGGGGITDVLLRLLAAFPAEVTVVRNHPAAMPLAAAVVGSSDAEVDSALEGADAVILALALTPSTNGIMDRRRMDLLHDRSVIVNVARGPHVVTDDLVEALRSGVPMGAGLDVTDPEPLPEGHPLWSMPNCIITPHVGNTAEMARPLLAERITRNVAAWIEGTELIGVVDPGLGY